MSQERLYPKHPLVGVGVLIRRGDAYLLIRRASEPDRGLWSVPGGIVEVGEKITDAAVREAKEETGLAVNIVKEIGVVDKVVIDEEGSVKYHFVIIDFLAVSSQGDVQAADDAREAKWVNPRNFRCYELSPTLVDLLKRIDLYP